MELITTQTRNKKSAEQYIQEYLANPDRVVLTDKQQEVYERIKRAWECLAEKGLSREQTAKKIASDFGVTIETARHNVNSTINIFGMNSRAEKEGMRMIVYEMISKTFQLAAKRDDLKTMAICQKNLIKVFNLDKDDPDAPDFARLEQHIYVMAVPPEQLSMLNKMVNQPGTINLNKIEDIDHVELPK